MQDLRSAYQADRDGEVGRAEELIRRQAPPPSEEDLRGFEWRYLWAVCQQNDEGVFPAPGGMLDVADISPDGDLIAGWDTSVVVYDLHSQKLLHRFQRFDDTPVNSRSVAFSKDGRRLAARAGNEIRVWRVSDWEEMFRRSEAKPQPNGGNVLVISPDGETLATAVEGGVGFWNLSTGQRLLAPGSSWWPTLPGDPMLGTRMTYSPDGSRLAIAEESTIHMLDGCSLALLTNVARAAPPDSDWTVRVLSLGFGRDYLAAGYRDGQLRLWETKTWNSSSGARL